MVLGIGNKTRRGPSTQVEYVIHVQDIKPWPPTQSLKTVRSVLIQWENGERSSGSTIAVIPSLDDGKIEFNESFRLPVMLSRDLSVKNGDADVFHKNLLELNLYELRRDKTVKGQLLGTAIIDLADYGIVKQVTSIGAPMNCTRSFRNTAQPILHLRIQAFDKARSTSSLRRRLLKEGSMDQNDGDSVSALMSEEYADEAEVASLTDDDISSHSSVTASSAHESRGASPSQNKENGSERGKSQTVMDYLHNSNQGSPNSVASLSGNSAMVSESKSESMFASRVECSTSCQAYECGQHIKEMFDPKYLLEEDLTIFSNKLIPVDSPGNPNSGNDSEHQTIGKNEKKIEVAQTKSCTGVAARADINEAEVKDKDKHAQNELVGHIMDERVDEPSYIYSLNAVQEQFLSRSYSPLIRNRFRHVKSVRSPMDSSRSNGSGADYSGSTVKQESKIYEAENKCLSSDSKTHELERRIKVLETELREAAAMEIALYSIVAEHGSSINKVHAPARRLSRLYLHAGSRMKRASAAQSTVSALAVVAKACGNDVPRLTFWLSNCLVLRAIVSEAFAEDPLPVSAGPLAERNGVRKGVDKIASTTKWEVSASEKQINRSSLLKISQDWEYPHSFLSAVEKIESWIFSRIVESVWWQTLTPHMQSSAATMINNLVDSGCRQNYRRAFSSGCQEQVNFSLELWKRAFKDACERLCPLRSGGHECGCLPVLAKLIMEQCVARLDVAMFNAILRESADDIPTDPVSDPISDAKVLPIPAGKSSFGAGAQLKNAIGNWSRWLTDLFGMDDDDVPDDGRDYNSDEINKYDSSLKSFHLLKSLSDLMMLPKDMLLSQSVRREVCPTLSVQLIKRVLENFVPDEFCPDPIPDAVLEALDSEEIHSKEGSAANFPWTAPAVFYCPPLASDLADIIGGCLGKGSQSQLQRSGSVLRRSNTSDDELDGLDSPLNSILQENHPALPVRPNWKVVQNHQENVVRYQLLREVWGSEVEL